MDVKLHGFWASPYSKRVELALKVKGIPYEYVEEDLRNKSHLLLQYNPVDKKVPVLVHHGKPIVESLLILEYIDETWSTAPRLLPQDSYTRATVRFWASFLSQELFDSMRPVVATAGEAQEKVIEKVSENLKVVEEGMKDLFPDGTPVINGENLGMLDIIAFSILSSYKAVEEAIGVKLLDRERNPLICSWVTALNELPVVKETIPSHAKMVAFFQHIRQNALQIPKP
ncbi:unnamed protein product [Ilex paraguariensis]|uniref:glutathione transferase n=1 Tax=Ilex paraguariensis TaxID=185542 RepID=A0ABC8QZE6_9AQUA